MRVAFVAAIHLVWLALLPVGLALATSEIVRGAFWRVPVGAGLMVLALPAALLCRMAWPPDFLVPGWGVTRVPITAIPRAVTLVQRPGGDFYETYFEIARPDGRTTRVMIDHEADKFWRAPHVVARGTRRAVAGAWVDVADGTIASPLYPGGPLTLTDADFARAWVPGR